MGIEALEVLHDVLDINLEMSYGLKKKLEVILDDVNRTISILEREMDKCAEEKVKWHEEHAKDQRTARVEEFLSKYERSKHESKNGNWF